MPLLFFPRQHGRDAFLMLWGEQSATGNGCNWRSAGYDEQVQIVGADGKLRSVQGSATSLLAGAMRLSGLDSRALAHLPASVVGWTLASKFALELASQQFIVPTIELRSGGVHARWVASLAAESQMHKLQQIVQMMSPSSYAVPAYSAVRSVPRALPLPPADGQRAESWKPASLLRAFLDDTVDAMVRAVNGAPQLPSLPKRSKSRNRTSAFTDLQWADRFSTALTETDDAFVTSGLHERHVVDELQRWSQPARGSTDRWRACFRLDVINERSGDQEPDATVIDNQAPFALRFLLQAPEDPSLQVTAAEVWADQGRLLQLSKATIPPQETLLEALGRAARLFPPIAAALTISSPTHARLDASSAWTFFAEGAAALSNAGFSVMLPAELTAGGQRRLRAVQRIGTAKPKKRNSDTGDSVLGLQELLQVDWGAAIEDETLSATDLEKLAEQKAPLVQWRGKWIIVDPQQLADVRKLIARGPQPVKAQDALRLALLDENVASGAAAGPSLPTIHIADRRLSAVIHKLRGTVEKTTTAPAALHAALRPYQERGLAWMSTLCTLGLGGCLADDMGLGKTVQTLALILAQNATGESRLPTLLVMPTSVLGNWQQECSRFAPSLHFFVHHGATRLKTAADMHTMHARHPNLLIATSFSVLRRDIDWMSTCDFGIVVVDEAQNIKTANAAVAVAARRLRANQRFALTGTPVENHLAELWSILEFVNPGLLGPSEEFRRQFEIPIQRHGDSLAAKRLRSLIAPFVLRRVKSDPSIISDLPAKNEMKVACTLSTEQASLYQAVLNEEMRRIESANGMARRGRVLALMSFLKQICNHPAQYLGDGSETQRVALAALDADADEASEASSLARSGKLDRLTSMLQEVIACGDKALVFTQFQQMGELLQTHLQVTFGLEVLFLHGGTRLPDRQQMIDRFSRQGHQSPSIFVLTVKAGGTGLNLTAANHVFHFDRWWNPAVEDQATDRAYRIGQLKTVSVHKMVCIGTVEEKIDVMLSKKKALADNVIGTSEQWITELDNQQLRQLFSFTPSAPTRNDADSTTRQRKTRKAAP